MSRILLASAAMTVAAPSLAAQPYLMVDETERLPPQSLPDPNAVAADTLDVELVDIDNDGDLDVWQAEGSGAVDAFPHRIYINDGTGHFTDESFRAVNPNGPANSTEVEFADVDCDGDLDAAVSNLTLFQDVGPPGMPFYVAIAGGNELFLNDGTGFFTLATLPQRPTAPFPALPVAPGVTFILEISSEVQFIDVDDDGDPDMFIGNENPFDPTSGGQNRLLINDGLCSGQFIDETDTRMPAFIDQTQGFRVADLDGDGDQDAVVVGAGENYLLRNQLVETGQAVFVRELTILPASANQSSTRGAILADVNGDGLLDLVAGNSRNEVNQIFLGDGTGAFTHAPGALPPDAATNTDVDAADLDGDGDLDLFFTGPGGFLSGHGFEGAADSFYVNDGTGTFAEATFPNFPERVTTSTDSAFGDVDGDGDLDLYVSASGVGPVGDPSGALDRLYLNHACADEKLFCLTVAADGLGDEIDALDVTPFPDGDMTGNTPILNGIRKWLLQSRVDSIQDGLDHGSLFGVGLRLHQIAWRVDGDDTPPDWVAGEAAARIDAWADFGLLALSL
ncbi:MAG: VCBS repeat-containing protein [Myxococcales bacterium]|nr:VCBS repeat-containing protein [Myxococcales bacterium]